MKRGFNQNQLAAVGSAVIACSGLENTLAQIYAIQKFAEANDEPIDKFINAAIQKTSSVLIDFVNGKAELENLTERERVLFNSYLTQMPDVDGRLFYPLIRWRNTLCHGMYMPMPDGKIQILFRDRKLYEKDPVTDEVSFSAGIHFEYTGQEIAEFAQNINDLKNGLFRVFPLSHYP